VRRALKIMNGGGRMGMEAAQQYADMMVDDPKAAEKRIRRASENEVYGDTTWAFSFAMARVLGFRRWMGKDPKKARYTGKP
jgi:hypothetical protein